MGLYYLDEIINKGEIKKKVAGCIGVFLVTIIAFLVADKRLNEIWLFSMRQIGGLSFGFFFDIFKFNKPKEWVNTSFVIYIMHCMVVKLLKLLFTKLNTYFMD